MDDTAQNSQVQPQGIPPQPVGSVQKEAGPISSVEEASYVEPAGAERMLEISSELSEQGVEKSANQETPQLTEEHKRIGIQHAKESTPVITTPTGSVQVSMPQKEAEHIVKTDKKTNSGILWIATIILRHAKIVHQKMFGSK